MTGILERLRARKSPPPPATPPPPPPIDSQAAVRFMDLVATFDTARVAHEVAVGRHKAAVGALANAERWASSAPDVERDGFTTQEVNGYGWSDGRGAVKDATRQVEAARRELAAAESAEGLARAALDEVLGSLVDLLGAAEDASRFLAMRGDLANRAVAAAEAVFQPAVDAQTEARRRQRHPRTPDELEHALHDGTRVAEAERRVEEADAELKEARTRARELVAQREQFERACTAALAHEERGRRR